MLNTSGAAGGRARLGPSAEWEAAISLNRSLPPNRRRDTTPDRLVRSFASGYGLCSSGGPARPGYVLVLGGARVISRGLRPWRSTGRAVRVATRIRRLRDVFCDSSLAPATRYGACQRRALSRDGKRVRGE